MKIQRLKLALAVRLSLVFAALLLSFQNCGHPVGFQGNSSETQYSGNGSGYSGKPDQFRHFDTNQPCTQVDRNGKPLPKEEIFFQPATSGTSKIPFLVREQCQDIAPQMVSSVDLIFSPTADYEFTYKNKLFSSQNPPGDFDVVASRCPAGTSPRNGAVRTNLIVSAQDWSRQVSAQGWSQHLGIGVSLNGSLNSLPSYLIVRNDANYLEEFRRLSQFMTLQRSTQYALSFLGRAGSVDSARFRFFRDVGTDPQDESLTVDFNFLTGVATIVSNANLAAAQVTMVPVANGFLCSVYFTTSGTGDQSISDIGISPTGLNFMGQVGDSVFGTAAQLERVTDFCQ